MKKQIRKMTTVFLMLTLLAIVLASCGQRSRDRGDEDSSVSENSVPVEEESDSEEHSGEPSVPETGGEFKTTFIKCGKADMIVLECGSGTVVIDTGEDDDGDKLTEYLYDQEIKKVDILIITHFDKDHVGGASFLLDYFPVSKIYIPDYEGVSSEYVDFMDKVAELGYKDTGYSDTGSDSGGELIRLHDTISFSEGDVRFTINPPSSYDMPNNGKEYDNDMSLITIAEHGTNTLLFTGDAENPRIKDFMEKHLITACDLIKMPHHGRYHSELKELISTLQPSYAVIMDSEKNPAEGKTLSLLEKYGTASYSTARGNVTAVSDGKILTVTEED